MRDSGSNSNSTSGLESHPSSLYDGPSPFPFGFPNIAASYQAILHLSSLYDGPNPFPFGLHNTVASYQALLQDLASLVRRIPLTGAQEGLILTVTSQDYIVHWSGSISEDGSTGLVDTMIVLPYQEGDSIHDAEVFTEILDNSDSIEAGMNDGAIHTREVFMVCRSRSPLIPPKQPDIRSSDESKSNISPDAQGDDSEAKI
jgi:hypothetical protein